MRKRFSGNFILTVLALTTGLTTFALGQSDAARLLYDSAATVKTNLDGIRTFPLPPAEFQPWKASDLELATYGFPPHPDKEAHPHGYLLWEKAMMRTKHRWTGEMKQDSSVLIRPLQLSKAQPAQVKSEVGPTTKYSSNWSGVANTNTLTKWNAKAAFSSVTSEFIVPVASPSLGTCNGVQTTVVVSAIDGVLNSETLYAGITSSVDCGSNGVQQQYGLTYGWYPYSGATVIPWTNAGDDIFVQVYSASGGCNPGNVFVEDETTLTYISYQISPPGPPCLVGNSAEFFVEDCCGDPIANYVWEPALAWDFDAKGTEFGPGETSASTYIIEMVDSDNSPISIPVVEGKYSLWLHDTGCAYSGGCTP